MQIPIECRHEFITYDNKQYPCTISLAMDLIGGKWKAVILYHLRHKKQRFKELHEQLSFITEATLSKQLKELENSKLIIRKQYGNKPPIKTEYELSEFGKSVLPLLDAITHWGNDVMVSCGAFVD